MVRQIGRLSLATLFLIGLFSCGGGGGGGSTETSSTSTQVELPPFAQNEPDISEETPQLIDVAYFEAQRGDQKLSVYFPYGYTVRSPEEETTRALSDLGTRPEVKIAWSQQVVQITMEDPDVYDDTLYIAMELVSTDGTSLDFSGVTATDVVGGVPASMFNYSYDVFNTFFEVFKDSSSNEATLSLDFGTSLLAEGASNNYYFGGWDIFAEGIKYQIPVRANDLPEFSIDPSRDGDGDGSPDCPLYIRSDGTIEFPTRSEDGTVYAGAHCIAYTVSAGSDDVMDNESTTVEIYKNGTLVGTPLNNVAPTSLPFDGTYSSSDLDLLAGSTGPNITFRISQPIGDGTVVDTKDYSFSTFGANDAATVTVCVTTDTTATNCTPGPQGDTNGAPITNTFKYAGTSGAYAIYYYDSNGNNSRDVGEPTILYDLTNKIIILPSTGGKIFYNVSYTSGSGEGDFQITLIEGTAENPLTTLTGTQISSGYVYSDYDTTTLPDCSSGSLMLGFHVYKLFGSYRSRIGAATPYSFCLNTPTSG